jgi:hypothetical protein
LERPKTITFEAMRVAKKNIMDAKNVDVLVGKNESSYFRINGSENDFMDNPNMIMDYQCPFANYL